MINAMRGKSLVVFVGFLQTALKFSLPITFIVLHLKMVLLPYFGMWPETN